MLKKFITLSLLVVMLVMVVPNFQTASASVSTEGYTVNKAVGYTINAVTSDRISYNYVKTGSPVLDVNYHQSLFNNGVAIISDLGMDTDIHYGSGQTMSDVFRSMSSSYEFDVSLPFTYKMFTGDIHANYQASSSTNYRTYSNTYYHTYNFKSYAYKLDLPNYTSNLSQYQNNLHPNFVSALNQLENKQITFEQFFNMYGTHFIGSAVYGAEADIYYSVATNIVDFNSESSTSMTNDINAGIIGLDSSNASVSISSTFEAKYGITEENSEIFFRATGRGSSIPLSTTQTGFSTAFNNWSSNISDEEATFIQFGKDGLIPIWNIIPLSNYDYIEENIVTQFRYYADKYSSEIEAEYDMAVDQYFPDTYIARENDSAFDTSKGIEIRDGEYNIEEESFFENDTDVININETFHVDFEVMKKLQYDKVIIDLYFVAYEVNDGYQHYRLYRSDDQSPSDIVIDETFEHDGNQIFNWGSDTRKDYQDSVTLYLSDVDNVDIEELVMMYAASGGSTNEWVIRDLYIKLTFIRNDAYDPDGYLDEETEVPDQPALRNPQIVVPPC